MIKFGPSGTSEDFTLAGHTHTEEMPQWLAEHELDCFEYSFGRGVRIRQDTATAIGAEFAKLNKEISVHAPYFINLATKEEEKAENNHRYIFDSLAALTWFGGNRCVIHPGSPLKEERSDKDVLFGFFIYPLRGFRSSERAGSRRVLYQGRL